MRHITIGVILFLCGSAVHTEDEPQDEPVGSPADALQVAIDETMDEARRAVDRFGETDEAMTRIQEALAKLARKPGLKERADLTEIHVTPSTASAALASEGDDGITLFVGRSAANTSTPVHDHLTWGVIHVLEGRERYIQWERMDDGTAPGTAELRVRYEKTLEPGQSAYWLAPPNDIHSQESLDSMVWRLTLTGKNLMAEGVTDHRHYFDPETGRVRKGKVQ